MDDKRGAERRNAKQGQLTFSRVEPDMLASNINLMDSGPSQGAQYIDVETLVGDHLGILAD